MVDSRMHKRDQKTAPPRHLNRAERTLLSARTYLASTPGEDDSCSASSPQRTTKRDGAYTDNHSVGRIRAPKGDRPARRNGTYADDRSVRRAAARLAEDLPNTTPSGHFSARLPRNSGTSPLAPSIPTLYVGGKPTPSLLHRIVLISGATLACIAVVFGVFFCSGTQIDPQIEDEAPAEITDIALEEAPEALSAIEVDLTSLELPAGTEIQTFAPVPPEGVESTQPVLSDASKVAIAEAFTPLTENDRSFAFALIDLDTGCGIASNVDAVFYGASSFKGPYCVYLCETQIEPGQVTRDTFVTSGFMKEGGAFVSQGSARLGSMMESTILYSSNDTYGALRTNGNDATLAAYLEGLGIDPSLAYDTWFPHYTVRDGVRLWINANEYLTSGTETAAWLEECFASTETSYLREAIGNENTQVLSKAGWYMESFENSDWNALVDAGIVITEDHRYLMSVMSNIPCTAENIELFENVIAAVFAAHDDLG